MSRVPEFDLDFPEFCRRTRLSTDTVQQLVSLGVIEPRIDRDYWFFSVSQVARCQRAERLRQDLDLNLHGAALAMDLMDRNRRLRARINYLEALVDRLHD